MKKAILICLISALHFYSFSATGSGLLFEITRIPHPLSMTEIQQQSAVANSDFNFNFKKAVNYYEENAALGMPAQGIIDQEDLYQLEHLGLYFHADDLSISGTPNKTGVYTFKIGAKNKNMSTVLVPITIIVGANLKDKPIFKQNAWISSATATKKYSLNLMSLLKNSAAFTNNNQVIFTVDTEYEKSDWLDISQENPVLLEGIPDKNQAGTEGRITLFATSNTGGNSEPLSIAVPVASNPEQKPSIEYFELEQSAGSQVDEDLSNYISDPAKDSRIKVILDKIEPNNIKLKISTATPTRLEGGIPLLATGQRYQITLHANTPVGGNSDPITIPLQVSIDKKLTPQFKEENPNLPMVYPGQRFHYNFVENRDVFPEYEDAPYLIQFAKDYVPPVWLKIENNEIFSYSEVPDRVKDSKIRIELVIKNIPGGFSKPIPLYLKVVH